MKRFQIVYNEVSNRWFRGQLNLWTSLTCVSCLSLYSTNCLLAASWLFCNMSQLHGELCQHSGLWLHDELCQHSGLWLHDELWQHSGLWLHQCSDSNLSNLLRVRSVSKTAHFHTHHTHFSRVLCSVTRMRRINWMLIGDRLSNETSICKYTVGVL